MTPLLRDVRDWLMEKTRLLPTRTVSRPPVGPPEEPLEMFDAPTQEPQKQRFERHTEIPPDQQPGGGPPHR
jgi:hypothetical protein